MGSGPRQRHRWKHRCGTSRSTCTRGYQAPQPRDNNEFEDEKEKDNNRKILSAATLFYFSWHAAAQIQVDAYTVAQASMVTRRIRYKKETCSLVLTEVGMQMMSFSLPSLYNWPTRSTGAGVAGLANGVLGPKGQVPKNT